MGNCDNPKWSYFQTKTMYIAIPQVVIWSENNSYSYKTIVFVQVCQCELLRVVLGRGGNPKGITYTHIHIYHITK